MKLIVKMTCLPGTRIDEAVKEAIETSKRLQVYIDLDFNGITLFITPSSSVDEKITEFYEELKRKDLTI